MRCSNTNNSKTPLKLHRISQNDLNSLRGRGSHAIARGKAGWVEGSRSLVVEQWNLHETNITPLCNKCYVNRHIGKAWQGVIEVSTKVFLIFSRISHQGIKQNQFYFTQNNSKRLYCVVFFSDSRTLQCAAHRHGNMSALLRFVDYECVLQI